MTGILRINWLVCSRYSAKNGKLKMLLSLSRALLSLIFPGSGLALMGRPKTALLYLAVLVALVAVVTYSRLIIQPLGWYLIASGLISIMLLSASACLYLKPGTQNRVNRAATAAAIILLEAILAISSFTYKETLLGIQIYSIPTTSMTPTLYPGDFILVDTRAYQARPPDKGDVVVFQAPHKFAMVKRVSQWPSTGEVVEDDKLYVLGDNTRSSMDSRYTGGVQLDDLKGRVTIKLSKIREKARGDWYVAPI
jgi:signal peptidase I